MLWAFASTVVIPLSAATVAVSSSDTNILACSGAATTGGFGTFFGQNHVAGRYGMIRQDSDFIVALPMIKYADGVNCGRTVMLTDLFNGRVRVFVSLSRSLLIALSRGIVADDCPDW